MKILATNVYVGPSLYAHFPVIRHQVDIGALEDWPSVRLGPEFIDNLVEALPGLANHGCSYGEPGGFLRRLREDEGTWIAHIWEHAAIELQNMAGSDVSFGKTRSIGPPGQYNMVFEYKQKEVGLEAELVGGRVQMAKGVLGTNCQLEAPAGREVEITQVSLDQRQLCAQPGLLDFAPGQSQHGR